MPLSYTHFVGVLYDVDDTLLSNHPDDGNPYGLHERSRFDAIQSFAKKHNVPSLLKLTHKENGEFFLSAPAHTIDATAWNILQAYGIIPKSYNPEHPLVVEIVEEKARLHMKLLQTLGTEVPGATAFVRALEQHGLAGKQGIASGARHDEIEVFLKKYGLLKMLPKSRTVARGDYTEPKPNPDPFNRAFLLLGLPDTLKMRARTLAIEDDPRGVESAVRAGLYVVALTTRYPANVFQKGTYRPKLIARDLIDLAVQLGLSL